jgi:lipopolysaccharide transport system permease protein
MSSNLPITIYSPEARIKHPLKLIREMAGDLRRSQELAWRLTIRDISAQYRQTFLGYIWAFLLPLVNTATWLFLNGTGIVKVADTSLPYPVYVFAGTMLWQIFTEALQSPLQQVAGARSLLTKLNFPREALIVSGIYKTFYNAAIKIVILIPVIMLLGIYPSWSLFLFPLGILSIILVGNSLGLIVAPLGALYGDVSRIIPVITQFLMFITPVVFAIPTGGGWTARLFELNIMTPLIMVTRDWLCGVPTEWLTYFIWVNVSAFVLLLLGWIIYRITMPILIERMSA